MRPYQLHLSRVLRRKIYRAGGLYLKPKSDRQNELNIHVHICRGVCYQVNSSGVHCSQEVLLKARKLGPHRSDRYHNWVIFETLSYTKYRLLELAIDPLTSKGLRILRIIFRPLKCINVMPSKKISGCHNII